MYIPLLLIRRPFFRRRAELFEGVQVTPGKLQFSPPSWPERINYTTLYVLAPYQCCDTQYIAHALWFHPVHKKSWWVLVGSVSNDSPTLITRIITHSYCGVL
jgi:hypothetical protein